MLVNSNMLVLHLYCELRVANYNASGDKINKGFGKWNVSILKCTGLKAEKMPYSKLYIPGDAAYW
jgi:hypothetical protein